MYDWDVIIVGAGPAGLSAAIRVRWLKRHHCVPCSVLLCDPGGIGGLMRMGSTCITGPSWTKDAEAMVAPFLRDIKLLNIPVEREAVIEVVYDNDKNIFIVRGRSGKTWRSLSVVIATGMKLLVNEDVFFGKGVEVTCMSYDFIRERFVHLFSKNDVFPLAIIGTGKLVNLMTLTESLRRNGQELYYVIDDNEAALSDAVELVGNRVIAGRVEQFEGDGTLESLRVGGRNYPCSLAIVDFNSYELRPAFSVRLSPTSETVDGGFLQVDRGMCTSVNGLFAAGDITGMPASVAKAVGEGVVAGFSAYTYVYHRKFNQSPPLFAYVPDTRPLAEYPGDIPSDFRGMIPVPLVKGDSLVLALRAYAEERESDACDALEKGDMERFLALFPDASSGRDVLKELIQQKLITMHIGARHGAG